MDPNAYADTPFGGAEHTAGAHGYVAYFPRPIPRSLLIDVRNLLRLADAEAALGRLAGAGRLLPRPELLVGPYLRREAVASTRIEGTKASLAEVFDAEASDLPLGPDVEEVVNYVRAMAAGLERLASLPVSTRLIREMHGVILAGVRGRERQPGERYFHHPTGRQHAVCTQAADAVLRAERLTDLRERYRLLVQASTRGAANQVVDLAFESPVLTARAVEHCYGITRPAALKALRQLAELGVLVEVPAGPRAQLRWRDEEILDVLTAEA